MLVFVDESGDEGIKLDGGSSQFLVVCAVLFLDREEANRCDARINGIRQELGLSPRTEFHFSKNGAAVRKQFLRDVVPFDFFYVAAVVNKRKLLDAGFQSRESLMKCTCSLAFMQAKPFLNAATVIIDGSSTKEFRSKFSRYLKENTNADQAKRYISKVKVVRSSGNNLVQLADMICGAVARSISRDDRSYRDLISAREFSVRIWPD